MTEQAESAYGKILLVALCACLAVGARADGGQLMHGLRLAPPAPAHAGAAAADDPLAKLREAAEGGDVKAQNELADAYYYGNEVPVDYVEAMKWYRRSADQGNAYAQFSVGYIYSRGQGVEQDFGEALAWFERAAEQGNVAAQKEVADAYDRGKGVEVDYGKAMEWYRLAAEGGT